MVRCSRYISATLITVKSSAQDTNHTVKTAFLLVTIEMNLLMKKELCQLEEEHQPGWNLGS